MSAANTPTGRSSPVFFHVAESKRPDQAGEPYRAEPKDPIAPVPPAGLPPLQLQGQGDVAVYVEMPADEDVRPGCLERAGQCLGRLAHAARGAVAALHDRVRNADRRWVFMTLSTGVGAGIGALLDNITPARYDNIQTAGEREGVSFAIYSMSALVLGPLSGAGAIALHDHCVPPMPRSRAREISARAGLPRDLALIAAGYEEIYLSETPLEATQGGSRSWRNLEITLRDGTDDSPAYLVFADYRKLRNDDVDAALAATPGVVGAHWLVTTIPGDRLAQALPVLRNVRALRLLPRGDSPRFAIWPWNEGVERPHNLQERWFQC